MVARIVCNNLHFSTGYVVSRIQRSGDMPLPGLGYKRQWLQWLQCWFHSQSFFLSFSLFTYWGSQLLYCQLSFGEAHMARNSSPQSNSQQGETRCHVMKTFRQPIERSTKWKTKIPANSQGGPEAHQQLHEGAWKWIVSQSSLQMRQQPWLAT